jgi:competence protein ComEC
LTGLSRFPDPLLVTAAAIVAAWCLKDEPWMALLPALAAGVLVGWRSRQAAATSCAATLPAGEHRYDVMLMGPGEGISSVRVRGCVGEITARWPAATALAAGSAVTLHGRWLALPGPLGLPDGVMSVHRVDAVRPSPWLLDQFRTAIDRRTRLLFGPRAGVVAAWLTGARGGVADGLKRDLAAAGMLHLVGLAGFQLAILASWLYLLLRAVRLPARFAEGAAALAMMAWTALMGWPLGALRAALVAALLVICRRRQRQVRPAALLAVAALLMVVIDPASIAGAGFWLSLLGAGGAAAALRWSDRAAGRALPVRALSASLGATLATAPVAAVAFGQVSLSGPLLSVLAAPLVVAALPAAAIATVVVGVLPLVARGFAASANLLVALIEWLARVGAPLPTFGQSAGGLAAALPWLAVLLAVVWITWRRSTLREAARRLAWSATMAVWSTLLVAGRAHPSVAGQGLALLFLDVGQGDAALIRTPHGHWIEVDAGPTEPGHDAGRSVVLPRLRREGATRLDLLVVSHAHRDHVGGAAAVVERLPVALAVEPGELFADTAYAAWLGALAMRQVRWQPVPAGTTWTVDSVAFRVLHPPRVWPPRGDDLNEDSIVLEVRYAGFRALLMGDAGFVAESALGRSIGAADLLKVGHHGSATASSAAFLAAVQPRAAVISVGPNHYGHPAPATLDRLHAAGATVWRTDRDGTVTVVTDGRRFTVKSGRGAITFDTRVPDCTKEMLCPTVPR